ncbi:MAG: acetyl-CoA carboxylase biotin carboxyl carrier protein [Acidobacteria bacterium]|nr:acetyl-CoA carboxylase biotin carboxyl carrier protein [Acidobacteriota bacterium]
MNIKELKELIRLVDEKKLAEFELEQGDFKIRIRRDTAPLIQAADPGLVAEFREAAAPPPDSTGMTGPATAVRDTEGLYQVTSPIVGTFYRSPSPTADPFVTEGDHVEPHAPLCIIEAMKLMNEITSDVAGEVVRIYAENGQPVEYGQPLFGIRV